MSALDAVTLFAGITIAIVLSSLAFHHRGRLQGIQDGAKRGFRDGYTAGYQEGRKAADTWWIGAESDVGATRRQIWKEETKP